jgi:hypothetical protein
VSSHSEGAWIDGGAVHLDDVQGFSKVIPKRELAGLTARANANDSGRALYGFNWFDRDALNGALGLLHGPCANCHDAPATEDMGDGRTFCPPCCSAAQGSRYDDREDY